MAKNYLYHYLKLTQGFKSQEIEEAFRNVDRADFVPEQYQDLAYYDSALPIGFGGTISQPSTVLFMMNLLDPKPKEKILDIGSGSGWTTTLLSFIVGKEGRVYGLELVPELVVLGQKNLAKYNFNSQILQAGKDRGLKKEAPFDRILVSAAAENIPHELIEQLKVGGRLVIPIKNSIFKIDKISEIETKKEEFEGFAFVPLK